MKEKMTKKRQTNQQMAIEEAAKKRYLKLTLIIIYGVEMIKGEIFIPDFFSQDPHIATDETYDRLEQRGYITRKENTIKLTNHGKLVAKSLLNTKNNN